MNTIQTLIDRCNQDATYLAMENLKRQTEAAQVELAALLAAGNAMAERLNAMKEWRENIEHAGQEYIETSSYSLFDETDDAALKAWESVTK